MEKSPEWRNRHDIQLEMMMFYNSRGNSYTAWVEDGCAAEFDKLWKQGVRHKQALWEGCIAAAGKNGVKNKVNDILQK